MLILSFYLVLGLSVEVQFVQYKLEFLLVLQGTTGSVASVSKQSVRQMCQEDTLKMNKLQANNEFS